MRLLRGTAITLLAGLLLTAFTASAQTGKIPEGFTPLFDGKTLKGWHFGKVNHHGTNGNAFVENGEIWLKQHPYGQGGLLLTDKKYHNFEFYVEVLEAWGCNSGLFLRSTEGGSAYQIEQSGAGGPGSGALLGENLRLSKTTPAPDVSKIWKVGDWNSFRVRMEGDAPKITLWINDVLMWEVDEPINDKIADEVDGMIGLQLHWASTYTSASGQIGGTNWHPDAAYRFRAIGIKELK